MLDRLRQDLRFALRQIARHPGFSALLIFTIAVAIGGNVAIFSVLEGVVLRPLPYPDADRLVAVWETPEGEGWHQPFSGPDYLDVRAQSETMEEFGAVTGGSYNLSGDGEPVRIRGAQATASLFQLLGVQPLHGHWFTEEAELEGNERVVLLSYGLWKSHFGGDPAVVGRSAILDGEAYEIIGVMPESFRSPTPWGGRDNARIWVPLVLPRDGTNRGSHWMGTFGRMAPNVDAQAVEAELSVIAAQLSESYPDSNARTRMFVEPFMANTLGNIQSALFFLLAIVGMVLLIACANVGSMLLARGMNRAPEFAIRASMGAGKDGMVRQLLTESLTLALLGGGAGLPLAFLGVDTLKAILPESIPRGQLIGVNLKVLGFAFLVTALSGILVGLAPTFFLSRTNLAEVIKQGRASRGGGQNRLLSGLVMIQLAIGFILVNSAALFAVSYGNVMRQPHHIAAAQVLVTSIPVEGPAYEESQSRWAYFDEILSRVRQIPGVEVAGLTSKLPFRGGSNGGVLVKDRIYDPNVQDGLVEYTFVGDGYHQAMGIPLLAGRTLDERDMELAAASAAASDEEGAGPLEVPVIINRAMAERYWPDEDPLGEIIRPNSREAWFRATVIGVVENVRQWGPEREAVPEMFFPYTGEVWGVWDLYLTVHAQGNPEALAPSVREAIREVDPSIPVPSPYTMATVLEETTAGRKFTTLLITLFALTALVLIISGTYGVVSYAVGQRTHEIGVRMTLGADAGKVATLFLRRVAFLVLPGLAVGILGAWGVSRITRSMVYGIEAMSPIHLGLAGLVMVGVALAATIVPVRRATAVDPLNALSAD